MNDGDKRSNRDPGIRSSKDAILHCLKILECNNYEAYVVGGSVRDFFLGREISDIDIASSARPEEVKNLFAEEKVLDTGIRHGTISVLLASGSGAYHQIEITTFRKEFGYSDCRHPDKVEFTKSIEADLARRDLTINAMAWNPKRGLIDPFGGKNDLDKSILRAVGTAKDRFREDALRILRCLRFASELGFVIEQETAAALLAARDRLQFVAAERLFPEFKRLLEGDHAAEVIYEYMPVIELFLAQLQVLQDPAAKNYLIRMQSLPADFALRMAYLIALTEQTGGQTGLAATLCPRIKCSGKLTDEIAVLSELSREIICADKVSVDRARNKVFAVNRKVADVLQIKRLLTSSEIEISNIEKVNQELDQAGLLGVHSLAIDGNDLIKLGFKGKAIGLMLDKLYLSAVTGQVANEREALLRLADKEREEKA